MENYEKIEFMLRKELADRLPSGKSELEAFLVSAVAHELDPMCVKGGRAKSEKKTAAARLNGKKGGWVKGRPRKKIVPDAVPDTPVSEGEAVQTDN
jgi:hypothetical protein